MPGVYQEVEGQAAGAFTASGAGFGAEPDYGAAVAPAGAVVGDGDLGAGLGYFFFVDVVRGFRCGVESFAQQGGWPSSTG
jgi:hypothetical protein